MNEWIHTQGEILINGRIVIPAVLLLPFPSGKRRKSYVSHNTTLHSNNWNIAVFQSVGLSSKQKTNKSLSISLLYLSPLSLLLSFSLYLCLRIQQTAVFVAALWWNMEKALAATALRKFCRIHNIIMVNSDETFLQSKVNSTFNIPLNLINKSKNHNHSSDIPFLHSWLGLFPDSWIQRHILRMLVCGRPGGQSQLFFLPGNNKDLSQDLLVFLKFHMKSYV